MGYLWFWGWVGVLARCDADLFCWVLVGCVFWVLGCVVDLRVVWILGFAGSLSSVWGWFNILLWGGGVLAEAVVCLLWMGCCLGFGGFGWCGVGILVAGF